jgi:hypothetical protein
VLSLLERTVNLKVEETFPKVKAALTAKGCKVTSEEAPNQICFRQGSLWGISPQTAKKTITATLETAGDQTKLNCSSKLASDWKNITLIGCVFAFVLIGVCAWMASDLTAFIAIRQPSFWSWLVAAGGNVDLLAAQAFVRLTWGLTAFLSFIILLEATIVVFVHSKIDSFAKDALNQLN